MKLEGELVTAIVPLLSLIVLELSRVAREINVRDTITEKHGLFLFPNGELIDKKTSPQLGRFNFVHGASSILLCIGLFLLVPAKYITDVLLGAMIWVIWTLLPVFEVDEYDQLLANDIPYSSFQSHAVMVTITSFYIGNYEAVDSFADQIKIPILDDFPIAFLILLFLLYTANYLFLSLLGQEMADLEENEKPDLGSLRGFR